MGGFSEQEYGEKVRKVKEKAIKYTKEVRDKYDKIQKLKVEALDKVEEMGRTLNREILDMEEEMIRAKELAPESRNRLSSEIARMKSETQQIYDQLKASISKAIVPQ
jgi:phenylalanyl-tRNA synthetase alpha subunit